jgi:hypothetical protein
MNNEPFMNPFNTASKKLESKPKNDRPRKKRASPEARPAATKNQAAAQAPKGRS